MGGGRGADVGIRAGEKRAGRIKGRTEQGGREITRTQRGRKAITALSGRASTNPSRKKKYCKKSEGKPREVSTIPVLTGKY